MYFLDIKLIKFLKINFYYQIHASRDGYPEKCIACKKKFKSMNNRKPKIIIKSVKEKIEKLYKINVNSQDRICINCHISLFSKKLDTDKEKEVQSTSETDSIENQVTIECSSAKQGNNFESGSKDKNILISSRGRIIKKNFDLINHFLLEKALSNETLTPTPPSPKTDTNYSPPVENQSSDSNEEIIELPFNRVRISHIKCCLCLGSQEKISVIPDEARVQVFRKYRIYIPKNNRCCQRHLIRKSLVESVIKQAEIFSNTSKLTASEVKLFLENISESSSKGIHYDVKKKWLSDEEVKVLTGYTWNILEKIEEKLPSLKNSINRDPMQAIVIFLTKLRTGSTNSLIAVMFKLKNDSLVSDICDSVVNAFESDILASDFGFKSCDRNDLISNHTTEMVKKLLDVSQELLIIVDGTYVEHEKSRNNDYQRRSYNMHKHYNLVKPFTICTSDGFVIDIPCYSGSTNDAEILRDILNNREGLLNLLREGDIIVMDRGFRDVVEYVIEKGYRPLMPALKGKRKNLPTEEANLS